MSNERVVVKFTQAWRGYSKGERAGFAADQAQALVDGKVAELVKGVAAAAAPKNAKGKGSARKGAPENPADTPTPSAGDPVQSDDDTPPADDDDEPKP